MPHVAHVLADLIIVQIVESLLVLKNRHTYTVWLITVRDNWTEVRTTIQVPGSEDIVEWIEYPTYEEATKVLEDLATIARHRNYTLVTHTKERTVYVKPNGTRVSSAIYHQTTHEV
jgi:hypothetical protein